MVIFGGVSPYNSELFGLVCPNDPYGSCFVKRQKRFDPGRKFHISKEAGEMTLQYQTKETQATPWCEMLVDQWIIGKMLGFPLGMGAPKKNQPH